MRERERERERVLEAGTAKSISALHCFNKVAENDRMGLAGYRQTQYKWLEDFLTCLKAICPGTQRPF